MKLLRSAVRLVVCLPFLATACVLDRSATASECEQGPPCRLHELKTADDDGAVEGLDQDGAPAEFGDATLGDAAASDTPASDAAASDAAASEPPDSSDGAPQTSPSDAAQPVRDADASDPDAGVGPIALGDAAVLVVPSKLPKSSGSCPEFGEGTATFAGSAVRLWVGSDGESKRGPLVFYWHGVDGSADEALAGLGEAVIAEIKQLGGMVAALEQSTRQGGSTGTSMWSTGDYAIADEVLACAIEKGVGIDPTHIHAVGFGGGGLHSSWMAYARSSYLASVVAYSGGLASSFRSNGVTEDASNVVPAMLVHGKPGFDRYLYYDFTQSSVAMATEVASRGGFVLDCEHTLGHTIPAAIGGSALRFMKDHSYKLSSPYRTALPAGFPSYCKVP